MVDRGQDSVLSGKLFEVQPALSETCGSTGDPGDVLAHLQSETSASAVFGGEKYPWLSGRDLRSLAPVACENLVEETQKP